MTSESVNSSEFTERLAYFALDKDSAPGKPIFNRSITLKDAWAKEAQKG